LNRGGPPIELLSLYGKDVQWIPAPNDASWKTNRFLRDPETGRGMKELNEKNEAFCLVSRFRCYGEIVGLRYNLLFLLFELSMDHNEWVSVTLNLILRQV